ncbi:MAG TPA: uroporphyrinogen-III synthase [Polyangia bacterium]|nr:uroporphyrinogen-III synthase [Polyangia bacterium]
MSGTLRGARVLLTRRRADSLKLALLIEAGGGRASVVAMTAIGPPPDPVAVELAGRSVGGFDWVACTSRHGATGFLGGLAVPAGPRPRIAAVGRATAEAVRRTGWSVDLLAPGHGAEALAGEMLRAGVGPGARVLHPCSDLARTELKQTLERSGAAVVPLEVYRTLPSSSTEELQAARATGGPWNVAVFASPSTVTRFVELAGDPARFMSERLAVAIGPTTRKALAALDSWQIVESESRDDAGLVAAVEQAWQARRAP